MAADNIKANFNHRLEDLFKEAMNFAVTSATGGDYVAPDDDTINIANPENYYPKFP